MGQAQGASSRHESGPARAGFRQFQATMPASPTSHWPSISACLIVKNEAENLRPCLESLGDLASEIVVVDTGSTDDTVEIAREMGAKVFHFQWINDFAAARNESLKHATKEWIFWLDADDRLSPTAVAQLKAAVASGVADAYGCLVVSAEADGSQNTVEHIRLFRSRDALRFSGAIHETVWQELVRRDLRLAWTDIEIEHTGYAEAEAMGRKNVRNLSIVEREISLHPDQHQLLFYRGQTRHNLGEHEGARADMLAYLSRTKPSSTFDHPRFWAYAMLVSSLEKLRDVGAPEGPLRSALSEFPGHPYFSLLLGRLYLSQNRARDALGVLDQAHHGLQHPVRGRRPSDASVELAMAESSLTLGQRDDALRWAQRAHRSAPLWNPATVLLARLHLAANTLSEAERILRDQLESSPSMEACLLLADLRHRQGELDLAEDAIRQARKLGLPEVKALGLISRIASERESRGNLHARVMM